MAIIVRYRDNNWTIEPDKDNFLSDKTGLTKYLENLHYSIVQKECGLSVSGKEEDNLVDIVQKFYQDKEQVYPF